MTTNEQKTLAADLCANKGWRPRGPLSSDRKYYESGDGKTKIRIDWEGERDPQRVLISKYDQASQCVAWEINLDGCTPLNIIAQAIQSAANWAK